MIMNFTMGFVELICVDNLDITIGDGKFVFNSIGTLRYMGHKDQVPNMNYGVALLLPIHYFGCNIIWPCTEIWHKPQYGRSRPCLTST